MKLAYLPFFILAPTFVLVPIGCVSSAPKEAASRYPAIPPTEPIKLIYDGDIGADPCDFSTLSMLHEYHKRGMIELIGVMGSTPDPYLASTFSIYNQLYGNDIPIGSFNNAPGGVDYSDAVKKEYFGGIKQVCYADQNKTVYEKFGNRETKRADDVPHPVQLYRKLLSEATDNSITVYAAGPLFNFPALFASGADEYSPLSGEELLRAKVEEFVFMGGGFPSNADLSWNKPTGGNQPEYNWWALGERNIAKTTIDTLVKMGKPITYVGFEVGEFVLVGQGIAERLGRDHPTTESYYLNRITAPYSKKKKGPVLKPGNCAFDETALFFLVEGGIGKYFDEVQGRVRMAESGANTWVSGEGNERYLTLLPGVGQELSEIMTERISGEF